MRVSRTEQAVSSYCCLLNWKDRQQEWLDQGVFCLQHSQVSSSRDISFYKWGNKDPARGREVAKVTQLVTPGLLLISSFRR